VKPYPGALVVQGDLPSNVTWQDLLITSPRSWARRDEQAVADLRRCEAELTAALDGVWRLAESTLMRPERA
jgi:hypothetical protein